MMKKIEKLAMMISLRRVNLKMRKKAKTKEIFQLDL